MLLSFRVSNFHSLPELLTKILKSGKITRSQFNRLSVISSRIYNGVSRAQTARDLGANLPFVDRWHKRWLAQATEIEEYFGGENRSQSKDVAFILSLVSDKPRSGAPAKFDQPTKDRIIAIALDKPSQHGIPVEKWSQEMLAAYLIEQGIVEHICSSSLSNFLKSARSKTSS